MNEKSKEEHLKDKFDELTAMRDEAQRLIVNSLSFFDNISNVDSETTDKIHDILTNYDEYRDNQNSLKVIKDNSAIYGGIAAAIAIDGIVIYLAGPSVVKKVTGNFTKASTGTPIKKLHGIVRDRTILSNIGGGPVQTGKGGMKLGAIRLEHIKLLGEGMAFGGHKGLEFFQNFESNKIDLSSINLYKKLSRYNIHLSTRIAHTKAMKDRLTRIENRSFADFTMMEASLLNEYIKSVDELVAYLNKDL